jgi:ubiquinone/menaquinone biosynthesis C-methylase UbiE
MEQDWNARAREAPEYYIATGRRQWPADEFFQSGKINVENEILADADIICRGKKLSQVRAIEIGCGAGRMTRAMAAVFGEIHAVDISAEMVALAKQNLSDLQNVFLYKNNGMDLSDLPDHSYDFAFSFIVFQHIPDLRVIESYLHEVHRCLISGAVFKFQVQGNASAEPDPYDSWVGVPISLDAARDLAKRCRFELIRVSGEGTQYFWLWFQKPKWPWLPKALRHYAAKVSTRVRNWLRMVRFWCGKRVVVTFSPDSVRAGERYSVRIPDFAGQVIDVGYKFTRGSSSVTGVVGSWCELDSQGEALILAPAEHPTGKVRITKVRSRSMDGRWYRAGGAIDVAGRIPVNQP